MNLDYSEFLNIVESCEDDISSAYPAFKDIIKFYIKRPDQINIYSLTDYRSSGDFYLEETLKSFGLNIGDLISRRDNYILIVDPSKHLDDELRAFSEHVPNGVRPTHLFVKSNDVNIVKSILSEVEKQFGVSINITQPLVSDLTSMDYLVGISKSMSLRGDISRFLDIKDYVEELEKDKNPYTYLDRVNSLVEKIQMRVEESNRTLIPIISDLTGEYTIYNKIVSELYLRYNTTSYLESRYRITVLSSIMKTLFSRDYQLYEESIKYFKELPTLLVSYEDIGKSYHIVDEPSKVASITVCYCGLKDLSKSKTKSMDAMSLNIKSIYDYYDLDTIVGCESLKKKILDLYEIMDLKSNYIIKATDLIFFEEDGLECIGVILDFKFSVDVKTIVPEIGTAIQTLDYSKLKRCYPLNIFLDGSLIKNHLDRKLSNLNISLSIVPVKSNRKNTSLVDLYKVDINNSMESKSSDPSLSTLCLFGQVDYELRKGFIDTFIDTLGIESVRSQVDCFGGFNLKLVKNITLGGRNEFKG